MSCSVSTAPASAVQQYKTGGLMNGRASSQRDLGKSEGWGQQKTSLFEELVAQGNQRRQVVLGAVGGVSLN